jgi:FSR family fosmidomycin resistance protein-like MFS transporter
MTDRNAEPDFRAIFAITLVHFTGDFYSAFTSPLFPAFIDKLSLSLTQVGVIAGVSRFLAFVVQPSVGYLADRSQGRWFILGGLLLAVIFIPLSGLAASFWALLFFIAIGSIGSSMFHPPVAGMVPLYSGRKVGLSMSIFNTGGTFGFAVGPVFITWFAAAFGLGAVPVTMVFGLAVSTYLFFAVPRPRSEGLAGLGFFGALKNSLGEVWKSVALIWLVMVLRAVVGQSFLTYMPVYFVGKGHSLTAAGAMFSLFTVAGTLSGILSGHLSDKVGYKPIFYTAHTLMSPALILLFHLPGAWVYPGVAMAGAAVLATMPLGVVMAQELAPRGRAMVSSLMMGLAYGLGGIITPLVGKLCDMFTIQTVLQAVALLPLATLGLIVFFPRVGEKRRARR